MKSLWLLPLALLLVQCSRNDQQVIESPDVRACAECMDCDTVPRPNFRCDSAEFSVFVDSVMAFLECKSHSHSSGDCCNSLMQYLNATCVGFDTRRLWCEDSLVAYLLRVHTGWKRKEIIARLGALHPISWNEREIRVFWWITGLLVAILFLGHAIVRSENGLESHPSSDQRARKLQTSALSLLGWDIGPLNYDTHPPRRTTVDYQLSSADQLDPKSYSPGESGTRFSDPDRSLLATPSEYGGIICWIRDTVERILSFGLLILFVAFIVKLGFYGWYALNGDFWRLAFVPFDINLAVTIIGVALIVDGFIQVSAMTDAPGVSQTLDAVIVTVAGFIVMQVEARPGESSIVSFSMGAEPWLGVGLAITIAILYAVRWLTDDAYKKPWDQPA